MISQINTQVLAHQAPKGEAKIAAKARENSQSSDGVSETKQSRVERIASEIANGTYKLDMSKTAKAVLDSLS